MPGRYFGPLGSSPSGSSGANQPPRFTPDGLKSFTLSDPSVAIREKSKFLACLDCGFLWATVDPKKLRRTVEKNGTDETVQNCGLNTTQEEAS